MSVECADDELISTGAAAVVLGVRSATVAAWIRAGRLRGERQGMVWLVSRKEVARLAAELPAKR